jgi:leucyl-tRNA synthetase
MTLISTHLPSLNRQLPVYVAPYVLRDYGEGAVMGVPGHDARDYKFWRQHQPDAQVLQVIAPDNDEAQGKAIDGPYTGYGVLTKSCGDLAGMKSHLASKKIISDLQSLDGSLAEPAHVWKLRDWLISRQRYWGTPIPIIHCNSCGAVPVPLEKLPVELPKLHRTQFSRSGGNPLESAVDWVNTSCPKCGGPAKRETDTMDTFVDSSWYFMRYVDPYNNNLPFSKEKSDMLPVDIYIGGIEHAILHLLYARFMSKFLATTSLWPSGRDPAIRGEPFRKLISQGMVHGKTFSDPCTGRFLKPDEVDMSNPSSPRLLATGETPTISFEKMSKSKHNGVDPARCITQYGADVTRAHILFQAPVAEVLEWDESRIFGIQRWFGRVYRLAADLGPKLPASLDTPRPKEFTAKEMELWHLLQQTIEALTLAFGKTHTLNTAISDLMTLSNAIISLPSPSPLLRFHTTSALLRMLAPIAPAFAEECWEALYCGRQAAIPSILQAPWPVPVEVDVVMQPCAVTENGKLRFVVDIPVVPQESSQKEAEEWVLGEVGRTEVGRNWLAERKEWKRVVVVKGGRTVNFVR